MSFQSLVSNFALILFVLLVLTGSVWLLDVLVLAKQRRQKANDALAEFDKQLKSNAVERHNLELGIMRRPGWVEYTGSFFPVIALVFVLR
jgi:signal peptidase I